jgi:hypothetical protein
MRNFIFCLAILWATFSHGQIDFKVGTTWTYTKIQFWTYYSPTNVTLTKDTIINGDKWFYPEGLSGCSQFFDGVYLRKTADQFFYYDPLDQTENILYDFSKVAGESWVIKNRGYVNPMVIKVDSVGTIEIGDTTYSVQYINAPDLGDFVIEGIGSNGFLVPGNGVCDPAYFGIRCFNQDTVSIDFDLEHECNATYLINAIDDLFDAQISINPNPAINEIQIKGLLPEKIKSITLWNLSGQIVMDKRSNFQGPLFVGNLNKGIYIGKANYANHAINFRFIKM